MPSVEEILIAALSVVSSRLWSENHPEDPHHSDSEAVSMEGLNRALYQYAVGMGWVSEP